MRELLRNRDFRLLFVGQTLSMFGDTAMLHRAGHVGQGAHRLQRHRRLRLRRPRLPSLLAPLLGIVIDRFKRRTVMMVTDLVTAVVVLAAAARPRAAGPVAASTSWRSLYGASLVTFSSRRDRAAAHDAPGRRSSARPTARSSTVRESLRLVAPLAGAGAVRRVRRAGRRSPRRGDLRDLGRRAARPAGATSRAPARVRAARSAPRRAPAHRHLLGTTRCCAPRWSRVVICMLAHRHRRVGVLRRRRRGPRASRSRSSASCGASRASARSSPASPSPMLIRRTGELRPVAVGLRADGGRRLRAVDLVARRLVAAGDVPDRRRPADADRLHHDRSSSDARRASMQGRVFTDLRAVLTGVPQLALDRSPARSLVSLVDYRILLARDGGRARRWPRSTPHVRLRETAAPVRARGRARPRRRSVPIGAPPGSSSRRSWLTSSSVPSKRPERLLERSIAARSRWLVGSSSTITFARGPSAGRGPARVRSPGDSEPTGRSTSSAPRPNFASRVRVSATSAGAPPGTRRAASPPGRTSGAPGRSRRRPTLGRVHCRPERQRQPAEQRREQGRLARAVRPGDRDPVARATCRSTGPSVKPPPLDHGRGQPGDVVRPAARGTRAAAAAPTARAGPRPRRAGRARATSWRRPPRAPGHPRPWPPGCSCPARRAGPWPTSSRARRPAGPVLLLPGPVEPGPAGLGRTTSYASRRRPSPARAPQVRREAAAEQPCLVGELVELEHLVGDPLEERPVVRHHQQPAVPADQERPRGGPGRRRRGRWSARRAAAGRPG